MGELAEMVRAGSRFDWLRVIGAALLAAGVFLIDLRMQGDWASFLLFMIAAGVCAALYVVAFAVAERGRPLERWQTGVMIAALALAFLALRELARVLGADAASPGTLFWVTGLLTCATALIAVRHKSPIHTLIAALIFMVCFLNLIKWLGTDLSFAALRNLMAIIFVGYALGALGLRRYLPGADADHAHYLALAAGIAGLIAGTVGSVSGDSAIGSSLLLLLGLLIGNSSEASSGLWEVFLLAVSLLLIGYTWRERYRGTAYLAVVGLIAFVAANAEQDELWAWPLLLALGGAGAIAWSLVGGVVPPDHLEPEQASRPEVD